MYEYELEELKAATDNFSPSRLIGKGSHGSVYKGILKGGKQVAIKKQSLGLQNFRDNSKLENEARILSSLRTNSCLINLLGISHDTSNNKILVVEYMPNGTLHDILHGPNNPPPWPKRVEIALQIAKGLRILHESNPSIVHRDIKSTNILFDSDSNTKLADFGLAVRMDGEDKSNLPAGTIGYLDPSYTTPSQLSIKIDVFSYGVVLLELVSGRKVIDVSNDPASIVEWAIPLIERGRILEVCDKRVQLPRCTRGVIEQLLRLATRCVWQKAILRPSMGEIVANIEDFVAVDPIGRYPLLFLNCLRDVVFSMKGWRLGATKCVTITRNGACLGHDWESGDGGNSTSKRTLLVKEILADFTLD